MHRVCQLTLRRDMMQADHDRDPPKSRFEVDLLDRYKEQSSKYGLSNTMLTMKNTIGKTFLSKHGSKEETLSKVNSTND